MTSLKKLRVRSDERERRTRNRKKKNEQDRAHDARFCQDVRSPSPFLVSLCMFLHVCVCVCVSILYEDVIPILP